MGKDQNEQLTLFTIEPDNEPELKVVAEKAYRVVGDEVLQKKLDPECWAKALAAGGETRDAALSKYAQIRSEGLLEELGRKDIKAKALEERKLTAGGPDSEFQTRIVWRKQFSLMWDFLFWQILLSVSGVGLFLVLLAMGSDSRWWPGLLPLVVVSAFLQLSPVLFYCLGKVLIGRISYVQSLGVTAVLLTFLGGLLGVQTMMGKRSPRWVQTALYKVVEPELRSEATIVYDNEF